MNWRETLHLKVHQYIVRDISSQYVHLFLMWWDERHSEIFNELNELMDQAEESGRREALGELHWIVSSDANIEQGDPNVARMLHHLRALIYETDQEVEYENPSEEDINKEFPATSRLDRG